MLNFGVMRQLIIFATLLLVASCDTTIIRYECPRQVTVSPLQSIKFWPIDCQTYNEKEVCGINPKCWCQPWECDDTIPAQLTDVSGSYKLRLYNEADQVVGEIPFDETEVVGVNSFPVLSSFNNGASGTVAWVTGAAPKVTFTGNGQESKSLEKTNILKAGRYRITYQSSITSTVQIISNGFGLNKPLRFYKNGVVVAANNLSSGSSTIDFTLTQDVDKVGFSFISPLVGGNGTSAEIISFTMEPVQVVFNSSFVPNEFDICDEKIQARIVSYGGFEEIEIDALSTWVNVNTGSGPSWTPGANPSVSISSPVNAASDELSGGAVAPYMGTFSFDYDLDLSGGVGASGVDLWVILYKAGVVVGTDNRGLTSSDGNKTGSIEVTSTDTPDEVRIRMEINVGSINVDVNSFAPSPLSESTEIYKSDCLDIRAHHDCTELMTYKNNRNYDGLVFGAGSPETLFYMRVPMVFFHERGIEEDLVSEDNTQTTHISGKDVEQRQMELDYMPYYMHHRIRKILKMQTVIIDNLAWTKEASYDIQEGNKRYPLKKAECWLTKKTSIVRSIL